MWRRDIEVLVMTGSYPYPYHRNDAFLLQCEVYEVIGLFGEWCQPHVEVVPVSDNIYTT